jgi:hypothetical protein
MTDSDELNDIEQQICDIDKKIDELLDKKRKLDKRKHEIMLELDILRDWVWESDNENIKILRKELLVAAKLVITREELEDNMLDAELF